MDLRPAVRGCLDQFGQVQSRLAQFYRYAASEIQAALSDSLLLDPRLCAQAARCYDSVTAAITRLDDSRPSLLFSGPGAVATVMQHLLNDDGDCRDDPSAETIGAVAGFNRLSGLLHLKHCDSLAGRTVRLCRVGPSADAIVREFVDWVVAGQWLADRGPDDLLVAGEPGDGGIGGTWELEMHCQDLASALDVVVAPRLVRWTRNKLRHINILPDCALFLHHVDFARDAASAAADFDWYEPEREVQDAAELCVLHRADRKEFLMMHNRLNFACNLGGGPAPAEEHRQRAVDLVDFTLRDFMPDPTERRRRALISGEWEMHELLERQLRECSQATLRQLLADLCGLTRAVRGVCNCHLAKETSSPEQRRSKGQFVGDLDKLQTSAKSAARSFQRALEDRLSDLSVQIEGYLRRQEVKDRLASEFVQFCAYHPGLKRDVQERFLLELVGQELHNWNRESQIFLQLDHSIWRLKAQHFQQLCRIAERIPELVALQSDSFSEPPAPPEGQAAEDSLSSRTVLSLGIRQIGAQPMRRSFMQSLAVGIGMPLFVPLAAITMAIIWPVAFARRLSSDPASAPATPAQKIQRQLSQKTRKELTDKAWDFFDKISRQFIRNNFFENTRVFLQEDASKLEQFVERYCIVPQDLRRREELQDDPLRLRRQLENFQRRADGIVAEAKLFGATRLGYAMLLPDQCDRLGINCGVASESQLGERIGGGSFSAVFALPPGAEPGSRPPLALKLINAASTSSALLEVEMMRQLESDRHPHLLYSLGSVYFPALRQIGLLMPRCHCNLRQLLQQHRQLLVPAVPGADPRALANCLRLFEQILLGVRHLHGKRILHRDLKLENVLADLPDGGDPAEAQLRICDFGFAKEEETMSGGSFVGTIGYMAPELTPPRPTFTVKSDVFALGVMLWESYYGVSAPRLGSGQVAVMLNGDSQLDYLIRLMTNNISQERPHIEQCIAMLKLRQRSSEQKAAILVSFEDSLKAQHGDSKKIYNG